MDAHHENGFDASSAPSEDRLCIDQKELRSLLSNLSHELCRPLASLRAGFDLLLEDPSDTMTREQRSHLLTMVSLCDDLIRLARGYLDYAGLVESGRQPSLGTFSIGAIVGEINRQFAERAHDAGLVWETIAAEPSASVITDATLCQQIFANLISNSLKYTPRGGRITVRGTIESDHWRLAVIDNGPGIPADSLERVFDPFFRLPRDEHSRIEGNGLGLAICKELTELLDGSIELETSPGGGTTAVVRLPRSRPASDEPKARAKANTIARRQRKSASEPISPL
jgi:signal transduction histidine kinase